MPKITPDFMELSWHFDAIQTLFVKISDTINCYKK